MTPRISPYLFLLAAALLLQGCSFSRYFTRNIPGHSDWKFFPNRTAMPADSASQASAFKWAVAPSQQRVANLQVYTTHHTMPLQDVLASERSLAFLVIRHDSILYEYYAPKWNQLRSVTSFSVAKSFTCALVQFAVQDGYIGSVDDPITKYLPELKDRKAYDQISLRHLMMMTSGLYANPKDLSPWSEVNKLYYGTNLRRYLTSKEPAWAPGTRFMYNNANTALLGWALTRATGRPLTQYLQEKVWQPLGMEQPLRWSLDKKDGLEKAFCCLNATARDYARWPRLFMHNGSWQGRQLLDSAYVAYTQGRDTVNGANWQYHYHWRTWSDRYPMNTTSGLFNQHLVYCPNDDVIVVHFSGNRKMEKGFIKDIVTQVVDLLKLDYHLPPPTPAKAAGADAAPETSFAARGKDKPRGPHSHRGKQKNK